MPPLFDEAGQPVEGALTPEEVEALKTEKTELEEKVKLFDETNEKLTKVEEELQGKKEELEKLSSKDFNFEAIRNASKEERESMLEKSSAKERVLIDAVLKLIDEKEEERSSSFEEAKKSILEGLVGEDEEMRKKLEAEEKAYEGEAKNVKELEERFRKAYIVVTGNSPRPNLVYQPYVPTYNDPNPKKERFTDTQKGKDMMNSHFPEIAAKIYE